MAKRLGSFKGVWKQDSIAVSDAAPLDIAQPPAVVPNIAAEPRAPSAGPIVIPLPAQLLEHRYRLLVLQDHRQKLGRDLLDLTYLEPGRVAWDTLRSLGKSFRPWAHERLFALGCYLGVDMAPEVLRQLRHPLHFARYRRSMFALWRLLEMLAQKAGHRPLSRWSFRLCYACPPLGLWIYERQLQTLLRTMHGSLENSRAMAFQDQ